MNEETLKILTVAGWIISFFLFMPAIVLSLYTGAKLWKESNVSIWFMVSLILTFVYMIISLLLILTLVAVI